MVRHQRLLSARAWHFHRVPVVVCAATALFGVFELYRGTLEPFLFALMLVALTVEKTRPIHAAILIGLAAAIKIYPGLLLASFLPERRHQALLRGVAAASAATVISTIAVGFDVLSEWVAHTAPDAHFWRSNPDNLSLARIVGNIAPQFSPLLAAIFFFALTLILLAQKRAIQSQRRHCCQQHFSLHHWCGATISSTLDCSD